MLARLLVRYLRAYPWWLVGVLVFQFTSAMASLYLPRLNADIIDKGVAAGDTAFIWSNGVLMLGVALGQIVASIIATYFAARAAMKCARTFSRHEASIPSGLTSVRRPGTWIPASVSCTSSLKAPIPVVRSRTASACR